MHQLLRGMGIALFINLLFSGHADLALAQKAQDKAPRQGFPGRRVGAGTRDDKLQAQPLTALIPESNFGQTLSAYPTVQVYVPTTEEPKLVEVVLRDDQDNQVYKSTFFMKAQTELTTLDLFADSEAIPLELNRDYHWYVSVITNPDNRSQDQVVDGWIRRVAASADLPQKLAGTTTLEQVLLYQKEGLWYDAVAALVALRQADVSDRAVAAEWHNLLASVGLEHLSDGAKVKAGL